MATNTPSFELESLLTCILVKYKKEALLRNIEFSIIDDLASHVTISGKDEKIRTLLEMVLHNTISNSGSNRISFSTRQLLRCGNELLLEFMLEGNQNFAPRKFAYFRSFVTIKKLIEELNGKSELVTMPTRGAMLKFILTLTCSEEGAMQPADDLSGCACLLNAKRVLVVEDNEINQKIIINMLQKEGIAFALAANGKEAIDILEKPGKIDLILMDLRMPHMDGFETANYIRKKLKRITPIIAMIPGERIDDAAACLQAGMNLFIKKPFSNKELMTKVCSFFEPAVATMDKPILRLNTA